MLASFHFAYFCVTFYLFILCGCGRELLMYHVMHEEASGGPLRAPVDPGHQTQMVKLAGRNLYWQSHEASCQLWFCLVWHTKEDIETKDYGPGKGS